MPFSRKTGLTLLPLLVLGASVLMAKPAHAQTTAFTFTSATYRSDDSLPVELGYNFTTGSTALSVTALGYINDGFNGTHTIQIYQISNQSALLITPVSVTTVGGGPTSTSFTYNNLSTPILLAANTSYQIVSQVAANEHYYTHAQGFVAQAGLTIQTAVYNYSNTTTTPTFAGSTSAGNVPGDFGPNFQFTTASATPEPSQAAVLSMGTLCLAGLALMARRRKSIA